MAEPRDETIADSPARRRKVETARQEAQRQAENYEVTGEIARGGLGVILAATDKRLGRPVAIKRLLLPSSAGLARFRREVVITARLQHPNIIPVHEAGTWSDGEPFFVMKLVDGRPLSDVIDESKTVEERLALLPHIIAVADAIAYAHAEHVIHRDLKPSNVLVGPFGETVVIDWGLAKFLAEGEEPSDPAESLAFKVRSTSKSFDTTDGAVLGTPGYMAPEQVAGHTGDARTDVYALGAILYHLLCGQRAFFDLDREALLETLAAREPTPIDELAPQAPVDLIAIAEKAMAIKPEDRYPDAAEMAEELRRFSTGRLVGAREYTAIELLRRFIGRHRNVIATAFIAFVALVGLGVWSFANISEEREIAERNAEAYREAKSVAERRVDRLILDEARVLLDVDPTMAVARLKDLSVILPGAASIAADAEERGIAWRLLEGHDGVVRSMAMSPDGAWIASGGDDGAVVLWDAETGERRPLGTHDDRVSAIRFAGGDTVASASYDMTIKLWPIGGGDPEVLRGHRGAISALALAGPLIASASGDEGRVGLWRRGAEPRFFDIAPARSAMVALSADGQWLAAAGLAGAAAAWRLSDGRRFEVPGAAATTAIAFAGHDLVVGDQDGAVRRYRLEAGRAELLATLDSSILALAVDGGDTAVGAMSGVVALVHAGGELEVLGRHGERITGLSFSADDRLVSTSWDKTARVWAPATGDVVALSGHRDVVDDAALVGERLVTSSWDGSLREWRVADRERRVLRGHQVGVKTAAFSRGLLATGGHDDTVRLWPLDGGEPIIATGHTDHVYAVVFSPDGELVASSSDDRTVRLWGRDGSERAVLRGHTADVERIEFSPDGSRLASASEDDTARIWNVAAPGQAPVVARHGGHVTGLAFSPDGARLATSSHDGAVRIWPVGGGEPQVIARYPGGARDVAWTTDGASIVSVGDDGRLEMWRTSSSQPSLIAAGLTGARRIAVSPAGDRVAVVGSSRAGWLCPLAADAECARLVGHSGPITDVAFAPDGRLIATAAADNTARLWDAVTAESRVLRGHTAPVFGVAFSEDGSWLATASADTTARLWPVSGPPAPAGLLDWLAAATVAVFHEL